MRREDMHCAVFHIVCLCAYALAFWIYLHPELAGIHGPWSTLAFVGAAAIMLGWISGIDVGVNFHNHSHRPIFCSQALNRWFGRIWTVSGGWPSFYWQHAHVTVHHAGLLSERDWTLARRGADGRVESIYSYSIRHWPWRYALHLWRDFTAADRPPGLGRRALVEGAIFVGLWSIPFWIDPLMALGLWLLPQYLGNVAVMGPGMYAQHALCEQKSDARPLSHSNTFTNRFFNLTMFNIGYHIEHHEHPAVHWSALPELHERLRERMIERGARVVPMGYYRAGQIFCKAARQPAAAEAFAQHPDYVRVPHQPEAPEERLAASKP